MMKISQGKLPKDLTKLKSWRQLSLEPQAPCSEQLPPTAQALFNIAKKVSKHSVLLETINMSSKWMPPALYLYIGLMGELVWWYSG